MRSNLSCLFGVVLPHPQLGRAQRGELPADRIDGRTLRRAVVVRVGIVFVRRHGGGIAERPRLARRDHDRNRGRAAVR